MSVEGAARMQEHVARIIPHRDPSPSSFSLPARLVVACDEENAFGILVDSHVAFTMPRLSGYSLGAVAENHLLSPQSGS